MTPRILRISRESLFSLLRNKQRALLMMLGIIIGIASLTVVICVGRGTRDHVLDLVARHGLDTLMIRPGTGRPTPIPGADRSLVSLTEEDAHAIASSVQNVRDIAPVQTQGGMEIEHDGRSTTTQVFGVTPAWAEVRQFGVARGSFISQEDLMLSDRVCLIGQTVKTTLFANTEPIGQTIRVGSVAFTVKGILIEKGASVGGGDRDNRIVIPLTTAAKRLFARANLNQIVVQVSDVRKIHETAEEIRTLLRDRHRLRTDAEDDFSIREPKQLIDSAAGTSTTLMGLLAAITVIAVLVGGVVIMNIMVMSVSERSSEIGIRRAVGALKRDITHQFAVEAFLITVIAGFVGALLGLAVATLLPLVGTTQSKVTWEPFAATLLLCSIIALSFGLYPALKAARTDPIRALRG